MNGKTTDTIFVVIVKNDNEIPDEKANSEIETRYYEGITEFVYNEISTENICCTFFHGGIYSSHGGDNTDIIDYVKEDIIKEMGNDNYWESIKHKVVPISRGCSGGIFCELAKGAYKIMIETQDYNIMEEKIDIINGINEIINNEIRNYIESKINKHITDMKIYEVLQIIWLDIEFWEKDNNKKFLEVLVDFLNQPYRKMKIKKTYNNVEYDHLMYFIKVLIDEGEEEYRINSCLRKAGIYEDFKEYIKSG